MKRFKLLEGTTILGFLTAIVYFFPYTYKAAYNSYFGLPSFYQNFDLKTSIDASFSILPYIILFIIMIGIVTALTEFINLLIINKLNEKAKSDKKFKKVYSTFNNIAFFVLFPLLIIFLIIRADLNLAFFLLFIIFIIAVAACASLYLFIKRISSLASNIFAVVIFFIFFIFAFNYIGQHNASTNDSFYLLNENNVDYIVLGMKDDYYSVVRYDQKRNEITQNFKLISSANDDIHLTPIYLEEPPKVTFIK